MEDVEENKVTRFSWDSRVGRVSRVSRIGRVTLAITANPSINSSLLNTPRVFALISHATTCWLGIRVVEVVRVNNGVNRISEIIRLAEGNGVAEVIRGCWAHMVILVIVVTSVILFIRVIRIIRVIGLPSDP